MSNFCSSCGKEFKSSRSFQKICPACLKSEFSEASRMKEEEVEIAREKQAAAAKRQHARMAKLLEAYKKGTMFNMSGKIMFCVGLFFLAFCHLIFLLDGRGAIYWGVEGMTGGGKQAISMFLSIASVLLLLFSTRRFKVMMLLFSTVILAAGWYAPVMWKPAREASGAVAADAAMPQKESRDGTELKQPVTEEELAVYYDLKTKMPRATHYAVFMDNQDPVVRGLVRDALCRLLNSEYTRAYTRSNGILYVVANAAGAQRNISPIVERLGTIVNADVAQGIYIVRFDAEKTNLVCKFSSEVLSSPLNASFVSANISELQCLDAMRIRVAARSLKNANVQMLRNEIRDSLIKVLQDSWAQDQDTAAALIEALVTYASPGDKDSINLCRSYFMERYTAKKEVLPCVADFLIREDPEKMVDPVISYWLTNPMAWAQQLRALSWRVQPKLLEILQESSSIKDLNLVLRYLQSHGNADAIPAVKKLLEHPDSIIRYTAGTTLKSLEKAAAEEQ